jgi:hypothetical protein
MFRGAEWGFAISDLMPFIPCYTVEKFCFAMFEM